MNDVKQDAAPNAKDGDVEISVNNTIDLTDGKRKIEEDDIQELGRLVDLSIPDVDSVEIGLRFDSLMGSMKEIEELLGNQMDNVEPIPPVYPHEIF